MDRFLSFIPLIFLPIKKALWQVCKKQMLQWITWSALNIDISQSLIDPIIHCISCPSHFWWRVRGRQIWMNQLCDSCTWKCKVKCRMDELPRPWCSLLSATDETEFYRQLAPFTAFLEAITRLSPPHQPWVSTHWRTVKNLLSLSCIPQEGVQRK